MKVTQSKSGYRIDLSDAEFEVLEHYFVLASEDVVSDPNGQLAQLSPAAQRELERGRIGSFAALAVDQDNR